LWACPKKKIIVVIPGNQKNRKEMDWAFPLFFFGSIPQTGLHRKRKRKGREKLAFVWEEKKKNTVLCSQK